MLSMMVRSCCVSLPTGQHVKENLTIIAFTNTNQSGVKTSYTVVTEWDLLVQIYRCTSLKYSCVLHSDCTIAMTDNSTSGCGYVFKVKGKDALLAEQQLICWCNIVHNSRYRMPVAMHLC